MASTPSFFHTALRVCVLQILRAQGYHATRTSVIDSLTDLAARYLYALCESTAHHMAHNDSNGCPSIVDVRMALKDCGAILPEAVFSEQEWHEEDAQGLDEFLSFMSSVRNKEIKRVALDGDDENNDYLSALKKRHSKFGEDSKYNGTVFGRPNEHGEITVEGAEVSSIRMWQERLKNEREQSPQTLPASPEGDSRPPSSGLSSLGDRTIGDDMDLS